MNTKNKKSNPKISVIMTCYNYGKFIDEAIESVENQTFKDFELIIIDDCSTDDFTKNKINQLSANDYNIIQLKKNVGVSKARNLATEQAKGEYILYLDVDDKLKENCLQKMYDIIKQGKYDIVGCLVQRFKNGIYKKTETREKYNKFDLCINCIIPITSLLKKDDFKKIGGFKEDMINGHEDHDFWLRLAQGGSEIHIIQESLLKYRDQHISKTNYAHKNKIELTGIVIKNNYKI